MAQTDDFEERLTSAYERRKGLLAWTYSYLNPANLYMVQSRERVLLKLLRAVGLDLGNLRVLDVGCGSGGELLNLIRYGCRPENLTGIDMLPERIASARGNIPRAEFVCADAAKGLPWKDGTFDLVLQYTVFTSILERDVQASLAREMYRVLKPGGHILWYDFHVDNPFNKDVRGVRKSQISALFPEGKVSLKSVTLAPPIARRLAPFSSIICEILEKFRILNTHYIGTIKKHE